MTPLVRRRVRNAGSFALAIAPAASTEAEANRLIADIKLFAGGWVAGLVIFGTLFG